ncbi:MAG: hypothetical protein V3U75_06935 [Methylococcaceae bacterium]
MKLITFCFTFLSLFQLLVISPALAEPLQLDFPSPLDESIYCIDGVNGTSCIEMDPNALGQNQEKANLATDFQPLAKIKKDVFFPFVKMADPFLEAKCVSGGGSTAATGSAGGFCLASDLNTSATDFASFGVANELPVAALQFLQVTLKDGSTLVGSTELVDADSPMGSVCASAGGSISAPNGSEGFCLTADLSSDGPAAFAVANGLAAVSLQFLQVKFDVNSQLGSSSAGGVAKCTSINGSTASSGLAGGSCVASDLITSPTVMANFTTASESPVIAMQFLQMTFQDGSAPGSTNSNLLAGVECMSNGGSIAITGETSVSCLVSDLNASLAEDAGISVANDLPVAGMQLFQATFGTSGQPDGSNGNDALGSQCASLEGSTAEAGTSEEFCLTSDRNTSAVDFADFSMANALPISSLHFVQIPFQENNQSARSKNLFAKKSPMGVVIFDSVKKLRLNAPSIPIFKGIAGDNNRYFRISQKRSGIELKSGPNQGRHTRPIFWGNR